MPSLTLCAPVQMSKVGSSPYKLTVTISFYVTAFSLHIAPDTERRTAPLHLCSAFTPLDELAARKIYTLKYPLKGWKAIGKLLHLKCTCINIRRECELSCLTWSEQTNKPRPRAKYFFLKRCWSSEKKYICTSVLVSTYLEQMMLGTMGHY